MVSEAQKRANAKYDRKLRKFLLAFNKERDADVIRALEGRANITGYIRQLINADISRTAEESEER